ncbi:hypothetical protein EON65_37070 [archaeon]|nr:MAG: hypothetical protein EON65_37070 [archaeon]
MRFEAEEGGFLLFPKLVLESLNTGRGGGGRTGLLLPLLVALGAALDSLLFAPLAPATTPAEPCGLLALPSDVKNPDSSSICLTKT